MESSDLGSSMLLEDTSSENSENQDSAQLACFLNDFKTFTCNSLALQRTARFKRPPFHQKHSPF